MQRSLLWHLPFRRWVTCFAAAGYLMAVWGFPLPVQRAKHNGRPFPCQDHQCGCASADECWHSCCCYSATQKLAWAKRHHVEVPHEHRAQLAAAAKRESSCCHDRQIACCSSKKVSAPRSCCARHQPEPKARPTTDEGLSIKFVSAVAMRTCRGLPTLWCVSGAVLPPPARIGWQPAFNVVGQLAILDCAAFRLPVAPAVPPPRSIS